jgi:hypothetical protein
MLPLYAARIEDLGQGDFVKVDCAACHHVAVLASDFLLRLGLSPPGQGARPNGARPVPRFSMREFIGSKCQSERIAVRDNGLCPADISCLASR